MPEHGEFVDFVELQSGSLLRAAWVLTSGDWGMAEDLVQTTLGVVWSRWDRVAQMEAPEAYTRKVMTYICLRWRRRRWTGEITTAVLPEVRDAVGEFDRVDLRETLRKALTDLTPKQRAVIMLRYFEDRSEAEAARILDCSPGTVKSQAAKAMVKLRRVPGLADVLIGSKTS